MHHPISDIFSQFQTLIDDNLYSEVLIFVSFVVLVEFILLVFQFVKQGFSLAEIPGELALDFSDFSSVVHSSDSEGMFDPVAEHDNSSGYFEGLSSEYGDMSLSQIKQKRDSFDEGSAKHTLWKNRYRREFLYRGGYK